MSIFLIVIHVIVCIALIMIVLLQTGKGTDMGAAFGGGSSQTLFGSGGASTFLSKATTVAAVVFMLTSLFLAYVSTNQSGVSVISDAPASKQKEKASEQKQKQTDQAAPVPEKTTAESESSNQTATPKEDAATLGTDSAENSKEKPKQP